MLLMHILTSHTQSIYTSSSNLSFPCYDIGNNNFRGHIRKIVQMKDLVTLDLSDNLFVNALPTSGWDGLTSLKSLKISAYILFILILNSLFYI